MDRVQQTDPVYFFRARSLRFDRFISVFLNTFLPLIDLSKTPLIKSDWCGAKFLCKRLTVAVKRVGF